MNKLLQQRSFIRENIVTLVGICLCLYFSYHAFYGNRSLVRLLTLNSEISTMTQQYDITKAERETIETKVKAMRPGSVSKDLLEERVRTVLGYQAKDEVTLLQP